MLTIFCVLSIIKITTLVASQQKKHVFPVTFRIHATLHGKTCSSLTKSFSLKDLTENHSPDHTFKHSGLSTGTAYVCGKTDNLWNLSQFPIVKFPSKFQVQKVSPLWLPLICLIIKFLYGIRKSPSIVGLYTNCIPKSMLLPSSTLCKIFY